MKTTTVFNPRRFLLAAAFLAGLGFVTHASAEANVSAQVHPYLIDLSSKTATMLDIDIPVAVNDAGQVAGNDYFDRAFITGPNGVGMTDIGNLAVGEYGRHYSRANGINDAGQVVGVSATPHDVIHAFITGPNGVGMTDLGALGGGGNSHATGINDAGQVVGSSQSPNNTEHAFITGPNGVGMTDLGAPEGGDSYAGGINDAGQVAVSNGHAFITGPNGVGMTDLGTLGGTFSYTSGINAAGQVVGASTTADGPYHAFITVPNGVGMTDLGALEGGNSYATGINDAGQVVGYFVTPNDIVHAFITGPDGAGMVDLNSIVDLPNGVTLTQALDINNAGQVIARGVTIVPEPETSALFLAGLALVGFIARRKKIADAFCKE